MSPTIILKGCIATLMEVSRKMSEKRPNHMAALRPRNTYAVESLRLPALGRNSITRTAMMAPTIR